MVRSAPRVVVAPDKFKGSATAAEVAAALTAGILAARPDATVVQTPMADGGEGTVDAAVAAGFTRVPVPVAGPTGAPVVADFALRGHEAVVEMAAASGLDLLPDGVKDPLGATSRGTGELLAAALDAGATSVVLGVGGSASTDGGSGLLRALGARLEDLDGLEVPDGGGHLARAARLDLTGLDARLGGVRVVLAADVDHPLTGPRGAAAVFAPQKGASPADVEALETGLRHWAALVGQATGRSGAESLPGAGAAGGVGFAALAVLSAVRRPGVDVVAELVGLASAVDGADLVITGEGSLDAQSLGGKTPAGVAAVARRAGVSTVVVCGRNLLSEREAAELGSVVALSDREPDPAKSMSHAVELLRTVGEDVGKELVHEQHA
jgi:glycerate kinase